MNKELTLKRNNDINFEQHLQENLAKLDDSQSAAVQSDGSNILIKAPAGSGKTLSLISAVANYRYENLADRICAITFTRAARAEMEQRLQEMGVFDVEVTTIHVWSRNLLEALGRKYHFAVEVLQENQIKSILEFIVENYLRTARIRSVNIGILYTYITGSKKMDITDNYRRTLNALEERYIKYKRENGLYDFTDYPLYLYNTLEAYNEDITTIDALFVDEFQDVDSVQFKIFEKVLAKKKFFIGDSWQCQPIGTKINIRTKEGGIQKNIEDIQIGDPIVYYDQKQGYVSGSKLPHNAIIKTVTDIQSYEYKNDYLITITSEKGLKSSYTSNHRTFVRFNRPQDQEVHAVYLMCDENNRFRVGKIPLFYTGANKSSNPWRDKMRAEGCCKIWIVAIFNNDHDARVEETRISYYYRIPQTCWQTQKVSWTKDDLEYIYKDLDTFYGASICLKDYGLNIKYPLLDETVEWSKRCHFTSNASSEIYAINLIPNFMSCLVVGSNTSHKNLHAETIVDVHKEFIKEDKPITVFGLKVEGETYVADNIVTHNCIYEFRGADGEVFNKLGEGFDIYKLKYNYRSYQEIINYATTVYEELDGHLWGDCYISQHDWCDYSSIRCERGEGGIVIVINPFKKGFQVVQGNNVKPLQTPIQAVYDFLKQYNPMILCRTNKQVKSIQELGWINTTTIHQAKGLEYDNVVVVDTAIKDSEDLNVAYVAMTRARNGLLVIPWPVLEDLLRRYQINPYGI